LAACVLRVLRGRQLKKVVNFFEEKMHPSDLAGGFSDLEMTWLIYCAGSATGTIIIYVLPGLPLTFFPSNLLPNSSITLKATEPLKIWPAYATFYLTTLIADC